MAAACCAGGSGGGDLALKVVWLERACRIVSVGVEKFCLFADFVVLAMLEAAVVIFAKIHGLYRAQLVPFIKALVTCKNLML